MPVSKLTISEMAAKNIDRIASHYECADGVRPSAANTVTKISTLVLRLIESGQLSPEALATRFAINVTEDD